MDRPDWAPPEVDLERPSTARVYDYLLGGSHNFAVDRELAEQVLAVIPEARASSCVSRAFLRRAVEFLTGQGIRQFLDLGSGIPTRGNVHEVAPEARVLYVDNDPVAVAHSRAIVEGSATVGVLQADVRKPESIVHDPATREVIDFDRPVGILAVALLHFIPDSDRPADMLAYLRDTVVPGSYLVLSQVAAADVVTPEQAEAKERYLRTGPVALRSPAEIAGLFTGFDLVPPGLVEPGRWHPDPGDPVEVFDLIPTCAGVGVKR